MSPIPTLDEYRATLGRLTAAVDPTAATPASASVKEAAYSLAELEDVSAAGLARWVNQNPKWLIVLGLVCGISQEKLKNVLKHHFDTSGFTKIAREKSTEVIEMLDTEFDLVRLLATQRQREYDFGDVLIARAGTRGTAQGGQRSGRKIEDEIEAIANDLRLPNVPRTQFHGRGDNSPCDLAIPAGGRLAEIVVAAKGFDSTGSKLSDAVGEIEKMARVRTPKQFVMAVIDGIGWKSRGADLKRLYDLWESGQIDGMYTLVTLDRFRADLDEAATLRKIKRLP